MDLLLYTRQHVTQSDVADDTVKATMFASTTMYVSRR